MSDSIFSKQSKQPLVLAILIITVGVGWLLTVQGYAPNINWVWTLSLAVIGILTFVLSGGFDKVSIVIGPFLLASSLFSVLRQKGTLQIDTEVPILVILVGFLLLIAQLRAVPLPRWLGPPQG